MSSTLPHNMSLHYYQIVQYLKVNLTCEPSLHVITECEFCYNMETWSICENAPNYEAVQLFGSCIAFDEFTRISSYERRHLKSF